LTIYRCLSTKILGQSGSKGFIDKLQSSAVADKWEAYPPMAEFLAIVFRSHPDWIEKLIPPELGRKTATTLTTALQLAGSPAIPTDLRSRILAAGIDDTLNVAFSGLPNRIQDLQIATDSSRHRLGCSVRQTSHVTNHLSLLTLSQACFPIPHLFD
jgi:hypothetical protein